MDKVPTEVGGMLPRSAKPSQVTPDVTPEKAKNQRKRSNDQGDSSDAQKESDNHIKARQKS